MFKDSRSQNSHQRLFILCSWGKGRTRDTLSLIHICYTWGWVHELHTRNWSFRYASAAEPTVANGGRFDRRLFVDRGDVLEGERRYSLGKHPGTIRLLQYFNHTHSGSYAAAIKLGEETGTTPNIDAVKQYGTLKYGMGLNLEQEITHDLSLIHI